jgi:hypothetical protein
MFPPHLCDSASGTDLISGSSRTFAHFEVVEFKIEIIRNGYKLDPKSRHKSVIIDKNVQQILAASRELKNVHKNEKPR